MTITVIVLLGVGAWCFVVFTALALITVARRADETSEGHQLDARRERRTLRRAQARAGVGVRLPFRRRRATPVVRVDRPAASAADPGAEPRPRR